ncbi:50S ribosomal protein L29 [Candidatus Nitrosocosmicus franklandus]|uniref:Large ribosomal subunit protein uL29 n=1 Tax=Candidatus Nitrosocosmicus franklandianus TaxID=1798806 RepID=A0A484IEA9_9ARCH|nr:50S ribosomal protein L29 [Candidatus Nitrosocosmicus franklandus]VFJ15491.1 50S ribosomal protein L29 [Candidatus Nitrosocosmicus franklandus]
MARNKIKTLRQFDDDDLKDKLTDLKVDLAKLRSEALKGTLKKDAGVIRWKRRDIARILTIMNERVRGKKTQ